MNDTIKMCCIDKATEYLVDLFEDITEAGGAQVMIALRREDAIPCLMLLVEEYGFDLLLADISPEDETEFYGIGLWDDNTVAIEPLQSESGSYPMWDADYILADGDIPSQWLIAQETDCYDVIDWEDEEDIAYYQKGEDFYPMHFSEILELFDEMFDLI